ncbi:hypothetical protein MTO96_000806 [Rhipicephalus appendiculatus]
MYSHCAEPREVERAGGPKTCAASTVPLITANAADVGLRDSGNHRHTACSSRLEKSRLDFPERRRRRCVAPLAAPSNKGFATTVSGSTPERCTPLDDPYGDALENWGSERWALDGEGFSKVVKPAYLTNSEQR